MYIAKELWARYLQNFLIAEILIQHLSELQQRITHILNLFFFSLSIPEWGSMKIGEQDGLMFTVLQCVLQLPQFIPKDQRFDLLVLVSGCFILLF